MFFLVWIRYMFLTSRCRGESHDSNLNRRMTSGLANRMLLRLPINFAAKHIADLHTLLPFALACGLDPSPTVNMHLKHLSLPIFVPTKDSRSISARVSHTWHSSFPTDALAAVNNALFLCVVTVWSQRESWSSRTEATILILPCSYHHHVSCALSTICILFCFPSFIFSFLSTWFQQSYWTISCEVVKGSINQSYPKKISFRWNQMCRFNPPLFLTCTIQPSFASLPANLSLLVLIGSPILLCRGLVNFLPSWSFRLRKLLECFRTNVVARYGPEIFPKSELNENSQIFKIKCF